MLFMLFFLKTTFNTRNMGGAVAFCCVWNLHVLGAWLHDLTVQKHVFRSTDISQLPIVRGFV